MIAPRTTDEITLDWLQFVIDQNVPACELDSFELDRNFLPVSAIADVRRVVLHYEHPCDGPSSWILKLPTTKKNRDRALSGRPYEMEGRIYELLSENNQFAVPKFYGAFNGIDDGEIVLVLEDMSPATAGSQLIGCSVDDARNVLNHIADIHAHFWGDTRLPERNPTRMAERLKKVAEAGFGAVLDRFGPDLGGIRASYDWLLENTHQVAEHRISKPQTLVSGDLHVENILFSDTPRRTTLIDWQLGGRGLAADDVAFFLVASLSIKDRRNHESQLLSHYYHRLGSNVTTDYPFERFMLDYRAAIMRSLARPMGILGGFGGALERPAKYELADKMFRQSVAAVEDHDPVSAYEELA